MKKLIFTLSIALIALLAGVVAMANNLSDPTEYADITKPIVREASEPDFKIKLTANPSTGYRWFYDRQHSDETGWIEAVSSEYLPAADKRVGSAGTNIWEFKIKSQAFIVPSILKVRLVYARAWELDKPAKTLDLTIVTVN